MPYQIAKERQAAKRPEAPDVYIAPADLVNGDLGDDTDDILEEIENVLEGL